VPTKKRGDYVVIAGMLRAVGSLETKARRTVQFSPSVFVVSFTEGTVDGIFPTTFSFAEIKGAHTDTPAAEGIQRRFADRGDFFHSNSEGGKKRRVLRSSRRHSLKWLLSGMI